MFQTAIVLSLLMAATAWIAHRLWKYWLSPVWLVSWSFVMFWVLIFTSPPAISWVFLFLLAALVTSMRVKISHLRFAGVCAGCCVLAFGVAMLEYIPIYQEHQRIVARFPEVDLKPRLAYERKLAKPGAPLTGTTEPVRQLSQMALLIEYLRYDSINPFDENLPPDFTHQAFQELSAVHAGFVADFIAQPTLLDDFGNNRVLKMKIVRESDFSEELLERMSQPPELISQPAVLDKTSGSPEENKEGQIGADLAQLPAVEFASSTLLTKEFLREQNFRNIVRFAPPATLGAVNSQLAARAFQPHAFTSRRRPDDLKPRDSQEKWVLQRLELISLLKHDPPAVYVSQNLPAMGELVDAPTRATNEFEIAAISQLRRGEEIVTDIRSTEMHMVGAIRAIDECRKCHQVPRGALLGAFSYRFRSPRAAPNRAPVPKPLAWRGGRLANPTAG